MNQIEETLKLYKNLRIINPISWAEFLEDLTNLSMKIHSAMDINRIIGMPRRGLLPTILLALKLRTEVAILDKKYQYNNGDLLVDDDCVYGRKLIRIKDEFPELPVAVVYVSDKLSDKVDFYARILDFEKEDRNKRFILYPWMFHLLPKIPPDVKKLNPFAVNFDRILVGEL